MLRSGGTDDSDDSGVEPGHRQGDAEGEQHLDARSARGLRPRRPGSVARFAFACALPGTDGKKTSRSTVPRPLSWRVRGEECLIADRSRPSTTEPSSYTLARVI